MKTFLLTAIPYLFAGIIEFYYDIPRSVQWWLGAPICLAWFVGYFTAQRDCKQ